MKGVQCLVRPAPQPFEVWLCKVRNLRIAGVGGRFGAGSTSEDHTSKLFGLPSAPERTLPV